MRFRAGWLIGTAIAAAISTAPADAAVVLNEVNCKGADWVELVNTAGTEADISGWLLTDDPITGNRPSHRLILPSGTTIAGFGSRVVTQGAGGFPFGISCGDDTIRLANADGVLADEVEIPNLADSAHTWGRYPHGTGPWAETRATPEEPNALPEPADPAPTDAAAWLYQPDRVVEIGLTLTPEARAALNTDPASYVAGTFTLNAPDRTYGPYLVGVRLKGHASFEPLDGKSAFKIAFDRYVSGQRLLGLRRLTLNNMVQDPTMLREALGYEVFRAAGVPASRTGYAYVRVNGADYGLYANVEALDLVSLSRWFTSTQHLYEADPFIDVPDWVAGLQVDEGSNANRSDLTGLIASLDDGTLTTGQSASADLDELTRMWAAERYMGHWDGYSGVAGPNNYYLHSDATGMFSMLPWGLDQTWGDESAFDQSGGGILFRACLAQPICLGRYREAVAFVAERVGELQLDGRVDAIVSALAPWTAIDPRASLRSDVINAEVAQLRGFLARRPAQAAAWLRAPVASEDPSPAPAPVVQPPTLTVAKAKTPAPMSVGQYLPGVKNVVTTVRVGMPGVLTVRVVARVRSTTVTLCKVQVSTATASTVPVRCPLSQTAQQLRATRAVPATVTTEFRSRSGERDVRTRTVTLARTPKR